VISVEADVIPEAWEKTVLAVCEEGAEFRTEYDHEGDPPSLDATVMVTVWNPLGEPRIHKNFPGGPAELEVYRQEVVDGIHDHWIDPASGKWTYTYHERLFAYSPTDDLEGGGARPFAAVDQVEKLVAKLAEAPHTRRAQAVTWMPTADPDTDDPPCLQRLWARLAPSGEGYVLNVNTHWRSRDLYKAWFMNVFALTDLQRVLAGRLSERMGRPVGVGRYVDISDSLHLYGSYRREPGFESELSKMRTSPWQERAWDTSVVASFFEETRARLAADPDAFAKGDV
jgi:thymidylate synthase